MGHKVRGICIKEGCEKLQANKGKQGYGVLCQSHTRMFKKDRTIKIPNKKNDNQIPK